jgi:hypothetical protein
VPLVASALSTERFLAQLAAVQPGTTPAPSALASRFGL